MADLRGRCNNVEYCANATTRRVVALPDDVPFACPKCGEPLEALEAAQRSSRNRKLLAVQAVVILAGAGAVGYKLLGIGARPRRPSRPPLPRLPKMCRRRPRHPPRRPRPRPPRYRRRRGHPRRSLRRRYCCAWPVRTWWRTGSRTVWRPAIWA